MKYECNGCSSNCKVETTCKPKRCLSGSWWRDDMWKEVSEPAPEPLSESLAEKGITEYSSRLPKLTVEVFDREDCPEDAKIAVVNGDGIGWFGSYITAVKNLFFHGCWVGVECGKWTEIKGIKFDASDWQNSLIERPEKLPKLTVVVFDREDCPEWAQWAGVNQDGTASFFGNVPNRGCSNPRKNYWSYHYSEMKQIPGNFDSSDWQHSLIKRPEKKKLPDWVKVGAWVVLKDRSGANISTPGRIRRVDSEGYFEVKWRELVTSETVDTVEPAYIRPWTFEEAPPFFKTQDELYTLAYSGLQGWVYFSERNVQIYTFAEVTELTQLSGSPCGVLEVAEVGK